MEHVFLYVTAFIESLGVVIVLAYLSGLTAHATRQRARLVGQGVNGVIFGTAAIACMLMPVALEPGVLLDLRAVVLMFAGAAGGPLVAAIAAALSGAFRFYLGGAAMMPGLLTIAVATLAGLVICRTFGPIDTMRRGAAAGLGLALLLIPAILLVPPFEVGLALVQKIGPLALVVFPLSAAIVARILTVEERRVRLERMLEASRRRFQHIAEVASDWFWEMDADLRFTYFSPRFEAITGLAPDLFLGRRRDEIALGGGDAVLHHRADLAARRPFSDFRYGTRRPDGTIRHISASGIPVFDDDGEFAGYRGVGKDITDEVERVEQLRAARAEAESANRSKSAFLANLSHELRTPLNAVIGFSDIMKNKVFGALGHAKYEDYADSINMSAQHLLQLINDLLDLSKIEAGRFEVSAERVDLDEVVREALALVGPRADAGAVALGAEVPVSLPPLLVDRRALRQVLLNLVSNAVKFTPHGGRVTVAVALALDGKLEIRVTDTGVGISPEDMARVLKPFEQARNQLVAGEGTGLGLPIARGLIELHGGTLDIESTPGEGTAVCVTLPRRRVLCLDSDPDLEAA